jgi:hypothetical protein
MHTMTRSSLVLLLALAGCAKPLPPVTSADAASDPAYTPPDSSGIVLDEKALESAKLARGEKKSPRAARVIAPNAQRHERQAKSESDSAADPPAQP